MSSIIIFAGGESSPSTLIGELPVPDLVIAADSGYGNAETLGFAVDVLIGDLDSLNHATSPNPAIETIRHPRDKDATDLELAFEYALRSQPRRIVLVGAEGGRFDHELSAISVLAGDRWATVPEIDWVRTDGNCHVIRGARRLQGDPGAYLSLIAIGGDAHGVTTVGLAWELSSQTLYAGSSRGISNQFKKPEVVVRVETGVLLAVVPNDVD